MLKRRHEDVATTTDDEEPSQSSDMAHTPKYTELEEEDAHAEEEDRNTFHCLLPPHNPHTFPSYQAFETHYNTTHANRCRECHKNFPSDHFLDLHLSENHDPIIATKRDKGEKTYACFVEGCDKVCADWKKRRAHLVDKHGFPRNYDFFIVNDGVDGRWSMLRSGVDANGHRKSGRGRGRRESNATRTTEATESSFTTESVVDETEDAAAKKSPPSRRSRTGDVMPAKSKEVSMDEITKKMSSLQFVPRSVKFGKGKGKSGFAKQ